MNPKTDHLALNEPLKCQLRSTPGGGICRNTRKVLEAGRRKNEVTGKRCIAVAVGIDEDNDDDKFMLIKNDDG